MAYDHTKGSNFGRIRWLTDLRTLIMNCHVGAVPREIAQNLHVRQSQSSYVNRGSKGTIIRGIFTPLLWTRCLMDSAYACTILSENAVAGMATEILNLP